MNKLDTVIGFLKLNKFRIFHKDDNWLLATNRHENDNIIGYDSVEIGIKLINGEYLEMYINSHVAYSSDLCQESYDYMRKLDIDYTLDLKI